VLYIATVHYLSSRWIQIQAKHLRKHLSVPYQTWTSLQGIDPSYAVHFDRVIDQAGGHPGKLNNLALEISHEAEDNDLIMFLDGDAFPIADPIPLIREGLAKAPLVAVRRAENGGDEQPHPCFCVTTVATWRELPGDWSMGHRWKLKDDTGRRPTDVGGNLLRALELANTPWVDVLRTNPIQLDPLFFAIYGETIYHHGAGFRRGGPSRAHYDSSPKPLPMPGPPLLRTVVKRIEMVRQFPWRVKTRAPQMLESKRVFEKIARDDPDWVSYIS
jgi:hypothetical protein